MDASEDDEKKGELARLDRRQQTLARILKERDPELLALYEAGRVLVAMDGLPGRANLIAHVVRELRRRIPNAFVPRTDANHDASKALQALQMDWEPIRASVTSFAIDASLGATVSIPLELAQRFDDIFRDIQSVSASVRERFLQMCAVINREGMAWSGNERLAKEWNDIRAEGIAHGGIQGPEAEALAIALFARQESILLRVFEYAQERKARIVGLAASVTSETLPEVLKELVILNDEFTFYQELNNPDLIAALRDLGVFKLNPANLPDYWPVADYLVKVATQKPEDVRDVLKGLPPVPAPMMRQLLAAALNLPDEYLTTIARKAKWMTDAKPVYGFADGYFKIVERLMNANAADLAIVRAGLFLKLTAEPPRTEMPGFNHPTAVPVCGQFFDLALKRYSETLAEADKALVLRAIAAKLDEAVAIEEYDRDELRARWFESMLEDHPTYSDPKRQLLVLFLEQLRRLADSNSDAALTFLSKRSNNRAVYQRATMMLLCRLRLVPQARELLLEAEPWRNGDPEHAAVVATFYPGFDKRTRKEIAQVAFDAFAPMARNFYQSQDRPADELDRLILAAFASRFGSAKSSLPAEYQGAEATVEPSPPSPQITYDALIAMEPSEAVDALRLVTDASNADTWSIGTALRAAILRNGSSWLANIGEIRRVPAPLLGWYMNGIFSYERAAGIDIGPVLEACDLAIQGINQGIYSQADREDMRHAAQSAGLVLADVAKNVTDETQINRVSGLVRLLGALELETPRDENREPWAAASAALGSPRGLAIHAAAELLVRAHNAEVDYSDMVRLYGEMSGDPTIAVRGALGQHFARFVAAAPDSAEAWAQSIFLSGDVQSDRASWAGYVTFSQVNQRTYQVLREAYRARLDDIAELRHAREHSASGSTYEEKHTFEATLVHIWILLANRVERLADASSLPSRMLEVADAKLLVDLIRKITSSLSRDESSIAQQERQELMGLWDAMISRFEQGQYNDSLLEALPSLIASTLLPADWRFAQAQYLAQHYRAGLAGDWQLVKSIRDLAAFDRKRSLELLELFARTTDAMILPAIQMYAGPLLRLAHSTGDPDEVRFVDMIIAILVSNHRPNILEDSSSDTDI